MFNLRLHVSTMDHPNALESIVTSLATGTINNGVSLKKGFDDKQLRSTHFSKCPASSAALE